MTNDPNRREVTLLGAAMAAGSLAAVAPVPATAQPAASRPVIGMLVHPDMVMLDLVGPLTVFSIMQSDIHLVWKRIEPCMTDVGIPVTPTLAFPECPADLDVLFVPGGLKGSVAAMTDPEILAFLADRGSRARYVTSVCTGGLVLGAAGLLQGYRATSHWYVRDLLASFGAAVSTDRVAVDRNRLTGGGVTAGIDFGLTLAALMRGEEVARRIQLVIEYAPKPPFSAGEPETAGPSLVADVLKLRSPLIEAARAASQRYAGGRL